MRVIAIITILVLLCLAVSGVKWIIRTQLILVAVLAVAMLDFVVGTLATIEPGNYVLSKIVLYPKDVF